MTADIKIVVKLNNKVPTLQWGVFDKTYPLVFTADPTDPYIRTATLSQATFVIPPNMELMVHGIADYVCTFDVFADNTKLNKKKPVEVKVDGFGNGHYNNTI